MLRGPVHVGSSAIKGMPGSPIVDLAIVIATLPPAAPILTALESIGYDYRGAAPHDRNDHWAMGGEGPKGHLGRVVLHITPSGSDFVDHAVAFVDYCNQNKQAFDSYAEVKLKGARLAMESAENRHRTYKMTKHKVVSRLLAEAKEWSKSRL